MSSATPLEKAVQATIKKDLTKLGYYVVKVNAGRFGQAGVTDLIVCAEGRYVGIEVKRPGWAPSDVTRLQSLEMERVRKARGVAGVASSTAEAVALVDHALGSNH